MSKENMNLPPPPPSSGKMDVKFIALAIICVVLAASLVSIFVFYQPTNLQAQIANKNKIISSLQENNTKLQNQVSSANVGAYVDQISSLESQLTELNGTLAEYNSTLAQDSSTLTQDQSIITLTASELLLNQQAISIGNKNATEAFDSALDYPGYIVVQATSTSNTTYVQTIYSSEGVNFNQTATLAKSGTATFPVLPSTVDVEIGNLDQAASNSTVTITYYY